MLSLPIIPNQKSKIGFYFHIPFCPHICPYCDFTKTSRFSKKDANAYFEELYRSLNSILKEFSDNPYLKNSSHCTVYFGGGTPSLFDSKFYTPIINILSKFFILEEITLETNPFSNKKNHISGYRDIGINRITLGGQSLCDNTLQTLGRKHTPRMIIDNIKWLCDSGINQIQVDLIYGLKTERTIPIADEIKKLIAAGATGISAYGLTLESRTIFAKSTHQIIDEEKSVHEYQEILDTCEKIGLKQIETSNFSFFSAKHNQLYWYGYPYFGMGTGAHGLLPPSIQQPYGIRYKVGVPALEHAPGDDILKYNTASDTAQNFELVFEPNRTKNDMIEELIFTLLRTEFGIPFEWLTSVLNMEKGIIESKIWNNPQISRAIKESKIIITHTHISIAPFEKIRGDGWALEFISAVLST